MHNNFFLFEHLKETVNYLMDYLMYLKLLTVSERVLICSALLQKVAFCSHCVFNPLSC